MGIFINHKKCAAYHCNKCLTACEKRVFGKFPVRMKKGVLSTKYRIEIVFPEYCNGCKSCETMCPTRAIKVDPSIKSNDMANSLLKKVLFNLKFKLVKFFVIGLIKKITIGVRR